MSPASPTRVADETGPGKAGGPPVLLFDGVCNLCSSAVRFVIERDPEGQVRFCSLQAPFARELLQACGMPETEIERLTGSVDGSMALVERGRVHLRSTAVLRLAAWLSGPWPFLRFFLWVPAPTRDLAYRFVAQRRYGWFGKSAQCLMPAPGLRERFLG